MTSERVHVRMGGLQVIVGEGTLYAIGLGSCVAAVLYDPVTQVAGFAHIMLPEAPLDGDGRPGRYAPTAVAQLIESMVAAGAQKESTFARIAGGAAMFAEVLPKSANLGERNVAAVKAALQHAGIPVHGEEVGGKSGRSVYFNARDGSLTIRVVQRADVVI